MRTSIGLFLVLFFVSSSASAHHSIYGGLDLLYNNSRVFETSIILIVSLIVATAIVILFKRISLSKTKL